MAGITQKSCATLFLLRSLEKTVMGYTDIKQQETYEKLKNRVWHSKWYWYFINDTTADDNNNDNTPASSVTATATTNKSNNSCNNYNNFNVIIIKNNNKNEKRLCIKIKKIKSSYTYCSPHFLFGEKNAP